MSKEQRKSLLSRNGPRSLQDFPEVIKDDGEKEPFLENIRANSAKRNFCFQAAVVAGMRWSLIVKTKKTLMVCLLLLSLVQGLAIGSKYGFSQFQLFETLSLIISVTLFNEFLSSTLEDYYTHRRHLLRVNGGLRTSAYVLGMSFVNFLLLLSTVILQLLGQGLVETLSYIAGVQDMKYISAYER